VRERGLKVRDRIHYIIHSILASQLGDPSGARGQAVGLLSQPVAQQLVCGGFDYVLAALSALLAVAVLGFLVIRYSQRHQRRQVVAHIWNAMVGLAGPHAPADLSLDAEGISRLREFIGIAALTATQIRHRFTRQRTRRRFTGHLTAACGLA
jgi:hypothetical protein